MKRLIDKAYNAHPILWQAFIMIVFIAPLIAIVIYQILNWGEGV